MQPFSNIFLKKDDGIVILTINRPKALNALNKVTIVELNQALDIFGSDETVKAIIITGSDDRSFVAGADIAEMHKLTVIEAREWAKLGQTVFAKIETLSKPVIAAINGFALGGGCELAMACDIRIASVNAKFSQPEVSLGIIAGFGGTQRLPRLVGKGRAKELLLTGETIDAAEAYRIGLVNKVVSLEELLVSAKKVAEKITSKAPIAVRLTKAAINQGLETDLNSAIAYEAESFALCFSTKDQKEGMSAFIDKRTANFIGQ